MECDDRRPGGPMRVEVLVERCVHSGYCVQVAPDVFELRQDGSHATGEEVPPDLQAAVLEAEMLCPSSAVLVRDAPDASQSSA